MNLNRAWIWLLGPLSILSMGLMQPSFADELPQAAVPAQVQEETQPPAEEVGTPPSAAKKADKIQKKYAGYIDLFSLEPELTSLFVKGDRGRFRQDWNRDDRTTGGVRNLLMQGAVDDVAYEYEGRAIVDYDYLSRLHIEKEDDFYFDTRAKWFRKFWDGSQDKEVWDPAVYSLPGEFHDWADAPLHTDRGNVDVEYGKAISDASWLVVGYQLWTRKGREPLLKAEQAAATGLRNLRALSMRRRVDGVSNTFYVKLPFVVNEIHHLEPLISYEVYRDSQFTDSARYNNGALNQRRDYIDQPQFHDLKAHLKYESFVTDDVYVHGGYLFDFVRNDSVRSEVRGNLANPNTYIEPDVDNFRVINTFSLGTALLDFLKKKNLDLRTGFRASYAVTDAHGTLYAGGVNPPTNLRASDSKLKEGWYGEAISLTWRKPRTTAYAGLDLEQRRLNWNETYDATSHESVTVYRNMVLFPTYETDITYVDFIPRVKLTHRFNSYLKSFTQYRWKSKTRLYDTQNDNDPVYYPGILGDQKRNVHEITQDLDVRLPGSWFTKFRYQLILDDSSFDRAEKQQQDWNRHRYSWTLAGGLLERLTFFSSVMYEYNRLKTPTDAVGVDLGAGVNRWAPGTGAYDYNGDVLILSANPAYQLTDKISTFLGYQFTRSLGDNKNTLNEATVGLNYSIRDETSLKARYFVFNFEDRRGSFTGGSPEGFDDDYYGHGFMLSLGLQFG